MKSHDRDDSLCKLCRSLSQFNLIYSQQLHILSQMCLMSSLVIEHILSEMAYYWVNGKEFNQDLFQSICILMQLKHPYIELFEQHIEPFRRCCIGSIDFMYNQFVLTEQVKESTSFLFVCLCILSNHPYIDAFVQYIGPFRRCIGSHWHDIKSVWAFILSTEQSIESNTLYIQTLCLLIQSKHSYMFEQYIEPFQRLHIITFWLNNNRPTKYKAQSKLYSNFWHNLLYMIFIRPYPTSLRLNILLHQRFDLI